MKDRVWFKCRHNPFVSKEKALSSRTPLFSVFMVFMKVNELNKHNTISYPKDKQNQMDFTFSKEREWCLPMKNKFVYLAKMDVITQCK